MLRLWTAALAFAVLAWCADSAVAQVRIQKKDPQIDKLVKQLEDAKTRDEARKELIKIAEKKHWAVLSGITSVWRTTEDEDYKNVLKDLANEINKLELQRRKKVELERKMKSVKEAMEEVRRILAEEAAAEEKVEKVQAATEKLNEAIASLEKSMKSDMPENVGRRIGGGGGGMMVEPAKEKEEDEDKDNKKDD